jgi:hypothetical protein
MFSLIKHTVSTPGHPMSDAPSTMLRQIGKDLLGFTLANMVLLGLMVPMLSGTGGDYVGYLMPLPIGALGLSTLIAVLIGPLTLYRRHRDEDVAPGESSKPAIALQLGLLVLGPPCIAVALFVVLLLVVAAL